LLSVNAEACGVRLAAQGAAAVMRARIIEASDLVRCIFPHNNHSSSCKKSARKS
jgi:hypothetical protein